MDSKDRDESTIRRRESALARRLGEALDRLNPQSAKDCPDADVIAAYSDRALGADESAQCENHFAACGRCRNILRVLAAASDAPLAENEVAQLGQLVSAVRAPVEITAGAAKRPRSKVVNWSTRWLAPAFGVAAVLTVWFVMRPPWRTMDRSGSPTLIAQAPREEMPETAPSIAVEQAEKTPPLPEVPPAKIGLPNSSAEPPAKESLNPRNEIRQRSPNASAAENLPSEKKESVEVADGHKAKSLATPAAPPALLPRARAQADSSAPAASATPLSANQSVAVTEAAPAVGATNATQGTRPQPATELPVNGRNFQALAKLRTLQENPVLLKSASGVTLWRVGIAGVIERSTDAGKTWAAQVSPYKEDWLAGAVVSETVCWIAGRNGAIARTTDGKNWESVAPPSQSASNNAKSPDWTGIAASDARTVTITANDGNKFATTDGGKTWQQQ
jgi:hypothetical protein